MLSPGSTSFSSYTLLRTLTVLRVFLPLDSELGGGDGFRTLLLVGSVYQTNYRLISQVNTNLDDIIMLLLLLLLLDGRLRRKLCCILRAFFIALNLFTLFTSNLCYSSPPYRHHLSLSLVVAHNKHRHVLSSGYCLLLDLWICAVIRV